MRVRVVVPALFTLCLIAWAAGDAAIVPQQGAAMTPAADDVLSSTDAITIPQMLNYQGKLLNAGGNPVPDSTYSVTFGLFSDAVGGSAFWTETQSVQTRGGLFNVLLGSFTPVSALPEDGRCYLQMQVQPDPPMTPRTKIVSAAYAFLAQKAESANYAASSPVTRPITPPVSGSEIAKPCTLVASVPVGGDGAVLRIRNDSTGMGLTIDSAGGDGVHISRVGSAGVYVQRANDGLRVDSAAYCGIVIYRAATGDAIFSDTSASHAMFAGVCARGFGVSHALDIGVAAWADTAGGDFHVNTDYGAGLVAHAVNNNVSYTAIRAYGKGYASGGWYTGLDDGEGCAPCLISPELGIVAAGTASLTGDEVVVPYPRALANNARTDIPVRITVTAKGEPAGMLYVSGADSNGFRVSVKRIPGWDSKAGVTFDWIAFGSLKEYKTSPEAKAEWDQAIRERDEDLRVRRARAGR